MDRQIDPHVNRDSHRQGTASLNGQSDNEGHKDDCRIRDCKGNRADLQRPVRGEIGEMPEGPEDSKEHKSRTE